MAGLRVEFVFLGEKRESVSRWMIQAPRRGDDVLIDAVPHEVIRVFWETFDALAIGDGSHGATAPVTVMIRAHVPPPTPEAT